jgi:hypothetical protein
MRGREVSLYTGQARHGICECCRRISIWAGKRPGYGERKAVKQAYICRFGIPSRRPTQQRRGLRYPTSSPRRGLGLLHWFLLSQHVEYKIASILYSWWCAYLVYEHYMVQRGLPHGAQLTPAIPCLRKYQQETSLLILELSRVS